MNVRRLLNTHRGLLIFTALNYLDKFVVFVLPLIVLFVSEDKQHYNDIEYVFSVAGILVTVMGIVGVYAFYGYRLCDDRDGFAGRVRDYFFIVQWFYLLLGLVAYLFVMRYGARSPWGLLYVFIVVRTLYMLFINFFNVYYRLKDKPTRIFYYSIPVNLLSVALIFLAARSGGAERIVEAFFLPQMLVGVGSLVLFALRFRRGMFDGLWRYLKLGILFSLPLIVNATCIAFISNYGKIYAYNYMSGYDMYCFSYTMRINMIIQMAHVSILAYYAKHIFTDESAGVSRKLLSSYALFIGVATVLAFVLLLVINRIPGFEPIPVDLSTLMIFLYTILYCCGAFAEVFYNRRNKNFYILLYSLLSCAVYLFLIFVVGVGGILSLSVYMVIYMVVYLSLMLLSLRKIERKYA